jgi:two-component system, NarL family, nitrate/nitrite response regulator NarL
VRILIVDDYEPWRTQVRAILAVDADLEVVGESADGMDGVRFCEELRPGLVLLDINLPRINGLEVARQIGVLAPETKVLFLSSSQSIDVMREALKLGAGFVLKADAEQDLLPIVQAICRNEPFVRFRVLEDDSSDRGGN